MASWLYPVGSVVALILLFSPRIKSRPITAWCDWSDAFASITIGHFLSQIVMSGISWSDEFHFWVKLSIVHYITACALNLVCLACRQMVNLVLVGTVAQLPILFGLINTLTSKSVCPGMWTANWLFWLVSHLLCRFIVPGFFIVKPLVNNGIPQDLSIASTVALFWAISYFGVLFLWETHRPFKVLLQGSRPRNEDLMTHPSVPVTFTERSPLVSCDTKSHLLLP